MTPYTMSPKCKGVTALLSIATNRSFLGDELPVLSVSVQEACDMASASSQTSCHTVMCDMQSAT